MDLHFIEATNGGNHGKFAVGRFTRDEWAIPSALPGVEEQSLLWERGWSPQVHRWVLDLQTGEGALFRLGGVASADLNRTRIWVCPLFEPFLTWLYQYRPARPEAWWSELPRLVELPDAPFSFHGYRREGGEG